MSRSTWTPPRDAQLAALWADGTLSATMIGRRLGITKNAVVGRAHRLRLPSRPSPIRGAVAPSPAPLPAIPLDPGTCRWALSEGRPWVFCDAPVDPGEVWCGVHKRFAYLRRRDLAA